MGKILKSYKEIEQLTGFSRDRLQFLIESGHIKINRPSRNRIAIDINELVRNLQALDVSQSKLDYLAVKDQQTRFGYDSIEVEGTRGVDPY